MLLLLKLWVIERIKGSLQDDVVYLNAKHASKTAA